MSYAASIYGHVHNPSVTAEGRGGFSRERGWLPGSIIGTGRSQCETEARLVMDRLLRECLTRKIGAGEKAVTGNLRNLHIARRESAV